MKLILVLNVGSSSLKFAVYRGERINVLSGQYDRLGQANTSFHARMGDGQPPQDAPLGQLDHSSALGHLLDWLPGALGGEPIAAVGHRLVHSGPVFTEPTVISFGVIDALKKLIPLAPNHLPTGIATVEAALRTFPDVAHLACFDTTFHCTMPDVAKRYGLPRTYHIAGLQRYGFHGLSYQYIVEELARLDPGTIRQRTVIAHLGSGSSICAVVNGQSVDTTMGLTPLSGLVMGTRCGDIDPEVVLFLASIKGLTTDEIRRGLSQKSGLLGVSEISADVRQLLACEATNAQAAEALALFCYSVRKGIAAMTAAAGGVDTLVFTGGIGTHAPTIRSRSTAALGFLGIEIDQSLNEASAAVISPRGSRVTVRVMTTNEEQVIAEQTTRFVSSAVANDGAID